MQDGGWLSPTLRRHLTQQGVAPSMDNGRCHRYRSSRALHVFTATWTLSN